ncbi:DNA repair protein RecN [Arcanobacterium ihumii]|uniref:DNA repair protein RecN n=1 Tax=Arcanobacterium ihumii TaxID=2138162 RepID=UPI000F5325D4|nr:DNA repair protein RecN [Arcanobacterium ihumii]
MIEELNIRDLGVIEEAHLLLDSGMTAITGETGAGKTMALTSLHLLMGGKADATKVRAGSEKAIVEGVFRVNRQSPAVSIIEEAGGEVETDGDTVSIIVSRHVHSKGRSRAFAGGASVPVTILQELAEYLVTVHGQSDQLRLALPVQHRIALDEFSGITGSALENDYNELWTEYIKINQELDEFRERAQEAGTERLALEALIHRIDATKPEIGEDEALRSESIRLENIEDLRLAISQTLFSLAGDETQKGALEHIDSSIHCLEKTDDEELIKLAQSLATASSITSEVVNQLGLLGESVDADPDRLNQIHERRAELRAIQRELSMDITTMLRRREEADVQLAQLQDPQAQIEQLETDLRNIRNKLENCASKISELRKQSATRLEKEVTGELQNLFMKDARFIVKVEKTEELSKDGMDSIEFLLAPHQGMPPGKLSTTASGGELSRVMLALEVILSKTVSDSDHTFIFDEVDAGIGGKTALLIGERLSQLSAQSQVLVVTHLAQVAAYAAQHVVVDKESVKGVAVTQVRVMNSDERERELARMLSGHENSEAARTHAAELLRGVTVAT